MSCATCYICLSRSGKLIQPDCVCKTLHIHISCFKAWLKTTPDMFLCSVCKTDVSPTFLSKFVTMEQLMMYSPQDEDEDDEDEDDDVEDIWFEENGVPVMEDDEGFYWFQTIEHLTIFVESNKRTQASQLLKRRHDTRQFSKKVRMPKIKSFRYRQ